MREDIDGPGGGLDVANLRVTALGKEWVPESGRQTQCPLETAVTDKGTEDA